MNGRMTIIHPTGHSEARDLTAPPGLDALQKAVGGYIETVPLFERFEGEPCVAYCNEDGKIQGLTINPAASRLWYNLVPQAKGVDVLVGPIVILQGDDAFMRAL